MFALSDAREYPFSQVPYLEREENITDRSNFNVLDVPARGQKTGSLNAGGPCVLREFVCEIKIEKKN